MIAELLVSIPLGALMAYGLLEARRSRIVGVGIAALAVGTLALAWLPALAADVAASVGFASAAELTALCFLALTGLALLNVHLKLRRQMHVITRLARELALAEARRESGKADAAAPGHGSSTGAPDDRLSTRDVLGAVVELKPLVGRQLARGEDRRAETPAATLLESDIDEDEGLRGEPAPRESTAQGSGR